MKKTILKLATITLVSAAVIGLPALTRAADTNSPSGATNQTAHAKIKRTSLVFKGTVSAVDTSAMTLKIGERTFGIGSETKIIKDGQPATLSDIAVGDTVGGAYKKGADGKLIAVTIHDGKKKTENTEEQKQ